MHVFSEPLKSRGDSSWRWDVSSQIAVPSPWLAVTRAPELLGSCTETGVAAGFFFEGWDRSFPRSRLCLHASRFKVQGPGGFHTTALHTTDVSKTCEFYTVPCHCSSVGTTGSISSSVRGNVIFNHISGHSLEIFKKHMQVAEPLISEMPPNTLTSFNPLLWQMSERCG